MTLVTTEAMPAFLTTVEAAELVRLSPRTLEKHCIHGTGPTFKKVCGRVSRHGVAVQRVMTDNGSAYRSKLFAKALQAAGARHVRTRPYTPRTNGKAERFIQTSLREWAYGRPYACSQERSNAIKPWTDAYNLTRPHSGIGGLTPWQRVNNLLGNDS